MPEVNKANRQVCDVHFYNYTDKTPFLDFDTANTTTAGLSGESVYAMAKGAKRISFPNPLEGTFSITAQVYPFKFFSLFSDGTVDKKTMNLAKVVSAKAEGDSIVTIKEKFSSMSNVYISEDGVTWALAAASQNADKTDSVDISISGSEFEIKRGKTYKISYFKNTDNNKSSRIVFNNKKLPKDYYVVMSTVEKNENGLFAPFDMIIYKATIQRNFELSFTSEGDPAEVTATFDILEDKDGNVLDFVELGEVENADQV